MSSFTNRFNNIPSIIETNERYIINGQAYKKDTMEFEHLNTVNTEVNSNQWVPCLIRRSVSTNDTFTSYNWHDRTTINDMFLVDNIDPTITYTCLDSGSQIGDSSISNTKVVAFKTENGKTKMLWEMNIPSNMMNYSVAGAFMTGIEFVGQSNKKIIVSFKLSFNYTFVPNQRYNQSFLCAFDKVDGVPTSLIEKDMDRHVDHRAIMYGNTLTVLAETDSNIYIDFFNGCDNSMTWYKAAPGMHEIFRYEKATDILVSIGTIAADTVKTLNTMHSSKGIIKDDAIYFYSYTNMTNPEIRLTKIDLTTHAITNTIVDITFNAKIKQLPRFSVANPALSGIPSYKLIIKEHNGKKYLHIFGSCTCYKVMDDITKDFRSITTFLINEETFALTAQDAFTPYEGMLMQGYVESIDNDMLIVTNRIAVKVLEFNSLIGKYEEIQSIDIPNNAIGTDTNNNIWVSDTSWGLHRFNIDLPTKVSVSFKQDNYDYVGNDIVTSIIVSAVNHKKQNIETTLELTLRGPAEFENRTKVIEVNTLISGEIEVPITIKGSGSISVYPKVIFK